MLLLCCCTSFSEMMLWKGGIFFSLLIFCFKSILVAFKVKAEQTIILTTISQIREREAKAELLGWIVSLN